MGGCPIGAAKLFAAGAAQRDMTSTALPGKCPDRGWDFTSADNPPQGPGATAGREVTFVAPDFTLCTFSFTTQCGPHGPRGPASRGHSMPIRAPLLRKRSVECERGMQIAERLLA